MLRGQGTLQQLLGRTNFGRPSGKRKPASDAATDQPAGDSTPSQQVQTKRRKQQALSAAATQAKQKPQPKQQLLSFNKKVALIPPDDNMRQCQLQPADSIEEDADDCSPLELARPTLPQLPNRPGWTRISSQVVGVRYRRQLGAAERSVRSGSCILHRDPENLRDGNAIQVVQEDLEGTVHVIGFVIAAVARHLAQIMDKQQLAYELHVHFDLQYRPTSVPMTLYCRATAPPPPSLRQSPAKSPRAAAAAPHDPQAQAVVALERAAAANEAAMLTRGEAAGRVLREHFLQMVDELREHDSRLFDAAELALMAAFKVLGEPAQCLFLRLHCRRGPWFHLAALDYGEVPDVAAAVADLVEHGYASRPSQEDCQGLLELLRADQARQLVVSCAQRATDTATTERAGTPPPLPRRRSGGSRTKADALAVLRRQLLAGGDAAQYIMAETELLLGACMRLTPAAMQLMERMQRIYFLSEAQDVSRFLATHAGAIRYPPYILGSRQQREHAAFDTREDLLAYEAALRDAVALEDCLQVDDWVRAADTLAPAWEAIRSGAHKRVRWSDGSPGSCLGPSGAAAGVGAEGKGAGQPASGGSALDLTNNDTVADGAERCGALSGVNSGVDVRPGTSYHSDDIGSDARSSSSASGLRDELSELRLRSKSADLSSLGLGPLQQACVGHRAGPLAGHGELDRHADPRADISKPDTCSVMSDHDLAYAEQAAPAMGKDGRVWDVAGDCCRVGSSSACARTGSADASTSSQGSILRAGSLTGGDQLCVALGSSRGATTCSPDGDGAGVGDSSASVHCSGANAGWMLSARSNQADTTQFTVYRACGDNANQSRQAASDTAGASRHAEGVGTLTGHRCDSNGINTHTDSNDRHPGQAMCSKYRVRNTSPPLKPLYLARFCSAWIYTDMAMVGVSMLERQKHHQSAVELLHLLLEGSCCPSRRGDWWQRLSIDLEHLGDVDGALQAAEASLLDPWVRNGDRLALQRRVLRLGKPPRRWKRPAWANAALAEPPEVTITARMVPNSVIGVKSQFYTLDPDGGGPALVGVEERVLQHYARPEAGGWAGVHTEGGVWATLFGLLMWDVLFGADCSPPGVFRTPFQTAPLDLDTDAFYPARKQRIDKRLVGIADGGAGPLLAQVWAEHYGTWCRGVSWERWTLVQLQDICRCIGGLGLSVVLRLQAEDHRGWRGGMPDLLLWRPDVGDAMMVEVKGPRDRLSDQQRAWLLAVLAVDVRALVLRVAAAKG